MSAVACDRWSGGASRAAIGLLAIAWAAHGAITTPAWAQEAAPAPDAAPGARATSAAPAIAAPHPLDPPAEQARPPAGRPARPVFEVRGFGSLGFTTFIASETFEAVLDKSGGVIYGGGLSIAHRGGVFVQVAAERFSADGERAFASGGDVFRLGIPLSLSVTPLEVTGGWRFLPAPPRPRQPAPPPKPTFKPVRPLPSDRDPPPRAPAAPPKPARRWIPYVGGGVGVVFYKEASDFAEAGDDVEETFTSYHVLGGVDVPVSRWIGAGVEVGYRWVPGALGDQGLAGVFGESDLGGFALRVKVTFGR
jgi:hypothetical protein